jgi:hypothetical protein
MKHLRSSLIAVSLGLVSFQSLGNPCAYMAPVVYSGFKVAYFGGLEITADTCISADYNSSSCKALEQKFNVNLGLFIEDEEYRKYIKNLAHDPIRDASNMAVKSTELMLSDLQGEMQDVAVEEVERLTNLGRKVTKKALSQSLSRFTSIGLCK